MTSAWRGTRRMPARRPDRERCRTADPRCSNRADRGTRCSGLFVRDSSCVTCRNDASFASWQSRHREGCASTRSLTLFFELWGLWHSTQLSVTGSCSNSLVAIRSVRSLWHSMQRSLPDRIRFILFLAPCGSWHEEHFPSTNTWWALFVSPSNISS